MNLEPDQVRRYHERGFVLVEDCFTLRELEQIRADVPRALAERSPRRVLERDGVTVRGVHGQHVDIASFGRLVRDPRLLDASVQLLEQRAFLYQFKLNAKAALTGEAWPWHQDFIFWRREDGLARPDLVTALLMLDDATEVNGPLLMLEGSHAEGTLDIEPRHASDGEGPDWVTNLTVDLKYALPHARVRELLAAYRIVPIKAAAGSVLFFHPNVVHGSSNNMSGSDRRFVLVTYSSVDNEFMPVANPRPDFLANRDTTALEADATGARSNRTSSRRGR